MKNTNEYEALTGAPCSNKNCKVCWQRKLSKGELQEVMKEARIRVGVIMSEIRFGKGRQNAYNW